MRLRIKKVRSVVFDGPPQHTRLQILLNREPRYNYVRTDSYYWGMDFPFLSIYQYRKGTTKGFAGRTIRLSMLFGGVKSFHGSLWDPISKPPEDIPEYIRVSYTTDPEVWDHGHTFFSGKILKGFGQVLWKEANQVNYIKDIKS